MVLHMQRSELAACRTWSIGKFMQKGFQLGVLEQERWMEKGHRHVKLEAWNISLCCRATQRPSLCCGTLIPVEATSETSVTRENSRLSGGLARPNLQAKYGVGNRSWSIAEQATTVIASVGSTAVWHVRSVVSPTRTSQKENCEAAGT